MNKEHTPEKKQIQVRKYPEGTNHFRSQSFQVVETISRKPWLEAMGNFNPMFCRYNGKRYLVNSDNGDLSDPFRRTENYLKTLFIEF
jgi:hypothetical protein